MKYRTYVLKDSNGYIYELVSVDEKCDRDDVQMDIDEFTKEGLKLGKDNIEDYVLERLAGWYGSDLVLLGFDNEFDTLRINA